MFDAKDLQKWLDGFRAEDADAIPVRPASDHVFTLKWDAPFLDGDRSKRTITNIPLGGKPEYGVSALDGKGLCELTDTNEVVEDRRQVAKLFGDGQPLPVSNPSLWRMIPRIIGFSADAKRVMAVSITRRAGL